MAECSTILRFCRALQDGIQVSKQGFEVPIGELLRGPLKSMFRDTVTAKTVESLGMLKFSGIERIYADHLARRSDHTDVLFALLSLCWWRQKTASGPVESISKA